MRTGMATAGLFVLVMCGPLGAEEKDGWVKLFDGKTLKGWEQCNGTATYRVEDGCIVGRTAEGSPNSFLCTVKEYADFELTFEVKVDDALNSGVQIRSKTKDNKKENRVHGPQVEIATDGNAGRVWGEALPTGWLDMKTDVSKTRKAFRNGEWNKYRVIAKGKSIRTWINDQPIADFTDDKTNMPRGFIGLQVHGIPKGKGPYEVRWRNILLKEVDPRLEEEFGFVDPDKLPRDPALLELDPANRPQLRAPTDPAAISGEQTEREKRMFRWILLFSTKDGKDYVRQLTDLRAMIALPVDGEQGKVLLIRDLKNPDKADLEDRTKLDHIYWLDERPESVAALLSALPKYGKVKKPGYFAALFPKELENRLAELELERAKRDRKFRNTDQIGETRFEVVPRKDRGFEVKVQSVLLRREGKPEDVLPPAKPEK